jgi:repressor LexA
MKIQLSQKESDAILHIRNWIVHKGRTPSVRELMSALGYKSPHSVTLLIRSLIGKGILKKRPNGDLQLVKDPQESSAHARTVNVPLVGTIACGTPIFAQENIEAMIPVSVSLASSGYKYFLLRAEGDSMDKAGINDGDLVLVRQQQNAENGDKVVALIDDKATVKEFHRGEDVVVLKPRSSNKKHKLIILTDNFQIQGVVLTSIPNMEED